MSYCRPSRCGRLSRPRSTTAAPPHPDAVGGHRHLPAAPLAGMRVGKHPDGSRVHVSPIGESGTQLCPGGPGGYATDHSPPAAAHPRPRRAADASVYITSACTTHQSDIHQVYRPVPHNEGSDTGSSRMPSHRAHHAPRHLAVLTRRGFVRAACHPIFLDPFRIGLPSALSGRCDGPISEVFHLRSENTRLTAHVHDVVCVGASGWCAAFDAALIPVIERFA